MALCPSFFPLLLRLTANTMYLPTKLPVALGSVLVLAVSSFIWKLAIHRRRFQHLVCTCPAFLLFLPLDLYLTARSAQTASQFSLWASHYILQSYKRMPWTPTLGRRSLHYPISI